MLRSETVPSEARDGHELKRRGAHTYLWLVKKSSGVLNKGCRVVIKGEANLLKAKIDKIVKDLHIGKKENNSINVTFNQTIHYNIPAKTSKKITEEEIKHFATSTGAGIMANPAQHGLSNVLSKELQPEELENQLAKAIVNGTGIAVSEYLSTSDNSKNEIAPHKKKKSVTSIEPDEINQYGIYLKNKFWKNVPGVMKPFVFAVYLLLVVAIVAFITYIVTALMPKWFDEGVKLPPSTDPPPEIVIPLEPVYELKNGGFESDLSYWQQEFNEQRLVTQDYRITHLYFTPIPFKSHTGQKCLYVDNINPKVTEKQIALYQEFEIKPNQNYRLTFYIKGKVSSRYSLYFHIGDVWDEKSEKYSLFVNPDEDFSDWSKQSGIVVAPNTSHIKFWLLSEDTCKAYIDDIELIEVSN